MNTKTFWIVFLSLEGLVIAQAFFAGLNAYLNRLQIYVYHRDIGYSLLDHGGWWCNLIFVSFATAWVVSKYEIVGFSSFWAYPLLACIIWAGFQLVGMWAKSASAWGEAHTHDGSTTLAGWIHMIYAVPVVWIFFLVYFFPTRDVHDQQISKHDLCILSTAISLVLIVGVMKFHPRWWAQFKTDKAAWATMIVGPAAVWTVTWFKLAFAGLGFDKLLGN